MKQAKRIKSKSLEEIVFEAVKKSDGETYIKLVESLFPVVVDYNPLTRIYNIVAKGETKTLEDIFGENINKFEK